MTLNIIINGQGPEPATEMYASGGTTRFIEIMKRISKNKDVNVYVISSKSVCTSLVKNGINAKYRIVRSLIKNDHSYSRLLMDSLLRVMSVCLAKVPDFEDNVVLYSPSDFLWDTFPSLVWKIRNKNAKWIVCVFLVVPTLFKDYTKRFSKNSSFSMPNFNRILYFLSQQLTIFLAKRWADQILVLNQIDKEYLAEKRGVNKSTLSVVKGGISYNYIKDLKATQIGLYDGIFLGRFHPQKGIFDLIKIWKFITRKKPKAKLCIIGSGSASFVEKVEAFIGKLGLSSNIELVGSRSGDEKFLLLKSSRIFLCPSYYESFAIVIAEALACGLPVVAYDLPIYEDIYGKNITRVPLGNINRFANVVISLLDDDKLRSCLSSQGQEFIQMYDWDKIAEREYRIIVALNERSQLSMGG